MISDQRLRELLRDEVADMQTPRDLWAQVEWRLGMNAPSPRPVHRGAEAAVREPIALFVWLPAPL